MKHLIAFLALCFSWLLTSCTPNKCLPKIDRVPHKIAFWNGAKRGANIFNTHVSQEDIKAAKAYGIQFIRLCPDKFPSKKRDFLMGSADDYRSIDTDDWTFLQSVLDQFAHENMPVVLTMLSLPGSRWKQLNGNEDDFRIWIDEKFQRQAACFWRDLAEKLRPYPIVVGYNILNEPHPERLFNSENCHTDQVNQEEVQKLLFDFNSRIAASIREVDPDTPIIIDSSSYADPRTFKLLQPLADPHMIYSFHMYEPYDYTDHRRNRGQYIYPGEVAGEYWGKAALKAYMDTVNDFQKKYKIPPNRILVGEFGCHRTQKGLPCYFEDLTAIFEENNWHWAFYAFRDNWDGMDYELGDKKLPWAYWQAEKLGKDYPLERNPTYPQFAVLKDALNQRKLVPYATEEIEG
jgi:aryl-phospho-beta-D-glucosidase BglC (GH1 family)